MSVPSDPVDFAIIGAQKSASTYLHRCLARHRHIDIPSEESRNFEDPHYANGGPESLESLFGPRREGVRRGIKRPDHLADPAVPARLVRVAPDIRILVVLREPVARAISAYFHYARLGFLPLMPLDDAFEVILDGSLARTHARAADVIGYGCYGRHLTRWLEHVAPDRLLVLQQQDMARRPGPAVTRALQFLKVDPAEADALLIPTRANRTTYDPRRLRAQRFSNTLRYEFSPNQRRRRARPSNPARLLPAGAAGVLDRLVLARLDRVPAPRLRADLEQRLRTTYAEDQALTTELLDGLGLG